jgi:probable HAF family extracellular repeat protein
MGKTPRVRVDSDNGMNTDGDILGQAYLAGNAAYHAFLYRHGAMNDLGTLGRLKL